MSVVLWGGGLFGSGVYGGGMGGTSPVPVSHIPASPPFNIYYAHPGPEMAVFSGYIEVELTGAGGQFDSDPVSGDFLIGSGGGVFTTDTAHFRINTPVTDTFTHEISVTFWKLPNDFANVKLSHAFVGVTRASGYCFGLFVSKTGISYTGNVIFDGGGNLNPNGPIQLLPNSPNLIEEGISYTFRVCVDSDNEVTYVYVTKTSDVPISGHRLRYVLPAFASDNGALPATETGSFVSARGTSVTPVGLGVGSIALGNGLLIPNLPPVADSGDDQGIRTCSIARLDGRASFDPEGAPITYQWRLIDGPDVSGFVYPCDDGTTYGSTLTNKIYSNTLSNVATAVTVVSGDVILYGEVAYNVVGTGTDGLGYYAVIDQYSLPPGLTASHFKLLKQNSISGPTTAQPSFYPDVQGVFKFDLIVSDGALLSSPSVVLLNVTDNPIPRGITPNVSFLWNYLSDFWRLVENTEVIETFWGSLAQVAASELLTLWQYDYNKSLRDIQRTFQRRWLHYDLYIREPYPDFTKVEIPPYGGIQSVLFPVAGAAAATVSGEFTISSGFFPDSVITLTAPNDPVNSGDLLQQLSRQLTALSKTFSVVVKTNYAGTLQALVINAPFPFTVSGSTTALIPDSQNGVPTGSGGVLAASDTYAVGVHGGVNESFEDLSGVRAGDLLVVDGTAYVISRILTGGSWPGQRIVTSDPLPLTIGSNWTIVRGVTSIYLDFYRTLCSYGDTAVFEVTSSATGNTFTVNAPVLSASAADKSYLAVNTNTVAAYLADSFNYKVNLTGVYRRAHQPLDELAVEIPTLQEKIKNSDDTQVLRQNVDYYIERFRGRNCIRFLISDNPEEDVWMGGLPPAKMWAETTFVDNRPTIESNFGIPASFTLDNLSELPSNVDYLSVVRGLWYTYFNGPTISNLRTGTQILLGLPFAEETGTIEEIRTDFSTKTGRILVRDWASKEIVREYNYPTSLSLETNPATGRVYAEGDIVYQFAPLVSGVEVVDYVKNPSWFEGYLNQGAFLEVDKFFKFLVRVDSEAFSLSALVFVKNFINRIKPTYTYPLYVVLKKFDKGTTVDITDEHAFSGTLYLNSWPCSFSNDGSIWGHVGGMYEDARSAYGGWRSRFDSDLYSGPVSASPGAAPTYPTAITPVHWGFDREYLCPTDIIFGKLVTTYAAPFTPGFDFLFSFDSVAFTNVYATMETNVLELLAVPAVSAYGTLLYPPVSAVDTGTMNHLLMKFESVYDTVSSIPVVINIYLNTVFSSSLTVTVPSGVSVYSEIVNISIPVTSGDILDVEVSTSGSSNVALPGGAKFFVSMGEGTHWAFDDTLPAGTYEKPVLL